MERWVMRTWWFLFPSFALLTIVLSFERACRDPYNLLAGAASIPATALGLAAMYVLAHVWIVAAYLITVARTQDLLPSARTFRETWPTADSLKVALMAAAVATEYCPVRLWRLVGAYFGCSV
jgi:hypothetical protein